MEDYKINLKKLSQSDSNRLSVFFSKNFEGDDVKLKKLFDFVLTNIPNRDFYAVDDGKIIYGALILLKRYVYYKGVMLDCCGLSFMAKEKTTTNKFIVKKLVQKILKESESSLVSLGFASKKMDNFWYRYGFIGIDRFTEFVIPIKKNFIQKTNLSKISEFSANDFDNIKRLYRNTYKKTHFHFKRSHEEWTFGLEKNKQTFQFKTITFEKKIVAYFMYVNNDVVELSYNCKPQDLRKLIFNYFFDLGHHDINFKLPSDHPFIKYLNFFDHTFFQKRVTRGGHIFRINNIKNFCIKIRERIENELICLNIKEYFFIFKGAVFEFKDKKLTIAFNEDFKENDFLRREFALLFFGYQNLQGIDKLLFTNISTRIPNLDHF